jgi:hypothetical protein
VVYSYTKIQRDALFLKFILIDNSTCFGHYVRSGCTGTVIGVEGFDSLSQIYFDNMFQPLLGHLQVIQFWKLLVCNVSHILILYSV